MTDTFTPAREPSLNGLNSTVTPRVLTAAFGDGYRQEAGDGLNALAQSLDLTWGALTVDEADAIVGFFADRGGYIAFLWAPQGGTEQKWKCTTWSKAWPHPLYPSVIAHFEQVFDL